MPLSPEATAEAVDTLEPSVGQQLRTAREAKGLTTDDVAKAIKLSLRQVKSLEADDWPNLPCNTIIRGSATIDTNAEPPSRALARAGGERRRVTALRGDLDTIALTCLQAEPARRYASAAALKRDLERHLAGLPIEARPDAFSYRSAKFLRRHRYAVTAGVIFALALLVTTIFRSRLTSRYDWAKAFATAAAKSGSAPV